MVKKAVAFYKEHGREKALNLVYGQNPKMVGKNLLEMRDAKDP